jgi:dolichol kinase
MVNLSFSTLTALDIYLAIIVDIIGFASLAVSCILAGRGYKRWIPRKFTHITVSSLIALALPLYSNLTGPALTIAVFIVGILGASIFGVNLARITLSAGTREEGNRTQTLLAAGLALFAYGLVFLLFTSSPMIFVASILAVSWGDGAGEVVGRPLGRHKFHVWHGKSKSIEGSLAVVLMTFVAVIFAYLMFPFSIPLSYLLMIGGLVSISVAAIEVICISWVDNVIIPIVSAILLWWLLTPFL